MKKPYWLLLFCSVAVAAVIALDLNWTAPTSRENGAPLAAGDIAWYRVYDLTTVAQADIDTFNAPGLRGTPPGNKVAEFAGSGSTGTVPNAVDGHRYAMTAVDKAGIESAFSNIVGPPPASRLKPPGVQYHWYWK